MQGMSRPSLQVGSHTLRLQCTGDRIFNGTHERAQVALLVLHTWNAVLLDLSSHGFCSLYSVSALRIEDWIRLRYCSKIISTTPSL